MMHICKAVLLDLLFRWGEVRASGSLQGGDIDSAVCWRVKWAQVEHTEQRDQIEGSPTFSPPACFPADKLNIWFGSMEQGRSVSFMSWEVHGVCVWGGNANSGDVGDSLKSTDSLAAWLIMNGWKTINKAPTVSRIKHTHTIKSSISIVSTL